MDLATADGVRWVEEEGGGRPVFDFSSAPMKVDLMYYCCGRTVRTGRVCVCVGGGVDGVCDCG